MAPASLSRIPQLSVDVRKVKDLGDITNFVHTNPATAPNCSSGATVVPLPGPSPKSKKLTKLHEELYCPGYVADDGIKHEIVQCLNPGVDRAPAVVGYKDTSLLTVVLYKPPFGTTGKAMRMEYPNVVYWERESSIRSLNRWRETIFQHHIGLGLEQASEWHEYELDFISQASVVREERAKSRPFVFSRTRDGQPRPYSWCAIAADFNTVFSGRKLPGSEIPRPARKRTELAAQNCRIKRAASPFRSLSPEVRNASCRQLSPRTTPGTSFLPRPTSGAKIAMTARSEPQRASSIPLPVKNRSISG